MDTAAGPMFQPMLRHDWTLPEIEAIYDAPLPDLMFRAQLAHRAYHRAGEVQGCVLLSIKTLDIPRVPDDQRLEIRDVGHDFYTVVTRYGFVEEPDIWRVLAQCQAQDLRFNLMETSVFVGREKLVISDHTPLMRWRKELFLLLFRLSLSAVEFFRVPSNRVVELGGQTEF
jgi:KUP system potassium uptake protein